MLSLSGHGGGHCVRLRTEEMVGQDCCATRSTGFDSGSIVYRSRRKAG